MGGTLDLNSTCCTCDLVLAHTFCGSGTCGLRQNINVPPPPLSPFWPSFDPEFICNASDNSGRYSYQAQPEICHWNLARLAEALHPDLPSDRAQAVLEEYTPLFNTFYLSNMRRKLGLLRKEEPEDEMLITNLMQTMHNTGTEWRDLGRL